MSLLVAPDTNIAAPTRAVAKTTRPDTEVVANDAVETREHIAARYTFAVARISL